ncbi:hypothetical protein NDU88_008878 [Pleurodeles waltl]|uniref:Reverse transcriptase RNase H-like domain-containing protein n=1 Tax=Pleurodeles waltl TaxID=8319 RepID=A0AAV7RY68_PLEWA|nr:hypothetical protein NDU88_008878 [Pleurodeles waltl]
MESTYSLEKPHAQVLLDNVPIKLLVDSGSLFRLISKKVYEEQWTNSRSENLLEPDIKAVGYAGKRIEMFGMRWMTIVFKSRAVKGKIYITNYGTNLLGQRHQKDLGIVLNPNAKEPVMNMEKQGIYEEVKKCILEAPALGVFDVTAKTFITSDASNVGIRAVLTQVKDEDEYVVGFASRRLQGAELSYSVIEREALACCWGINHFRFYLWGIPFKLRTDHKPLTYIFKGGRGLEGNVTPRVSRWLLSVMEKTFDVEFVKGSRIVVADYLSRMPIIVDEAMGE